MNPTPMIALFSFLFVMLFGFSFFFTGCKYNTNDAEVTRFKAGNNSSNSSNNSNTTTTTTTRTYSANFFVREENTEGGDNTSRSATGALLKRTSIGGNFLKQKSTSSNYILKGGLNAAL